MDALYYTQNSFASRVRVDIDILWSTQYSCACVKDFIRVPGDVNYDSRVERFQYEMPRIDLGSARALLLINLYFIYPYEVIDGTCNFQNAHYRERYRYCFLSSVNYFFYIQSNACIITIIPFEGV